MFTSEELFDAARGKLSDSYISKIKKLDNILSTERSKNISGAELKEMKLVDIKYPEDEIPQIPALTYVHKFFNIKKIL